MADNRTQAIYQALADFSALRREAKQAERSLGSLKKAEDEYNNASRRNRNKATKSGQARQAAVTAEVAALKLAVTQLKRYTDGQVKAFAAIKNTNLVLDQQNRHLDRNADRLRDAASAARDYARAQKSVADNTNKVNAAQGANNGRSRQSTVKFTEDAKKAGDAAEEAAADIDKVAPAVTRMGRAFEMGRSFFNGFRRDAEGTRPVLRHLEGDISRVHRGFIRFGNWRPRLTPPFVTLIPLIAAVIAGLNPLIALLGAVGTAAFGLASNIASLSGVFLALPGILSAVVAGITSVIASMGGVGNVFKTYAAMKKATSAGGGGVGETAADRADRLADAEANLARTQRQVQKAQQNLNRARQEALQDLVDLRKEVSRSSTTEERAAADLQMAIDAYNNVMADPSSQAGDKADARVRVKEAEQDLADVRERNIEAAKELNEAEAKGIEQSDKVLDAKESLDDAVRSQRDAEKALTKERVAGGAAGAAAMNEYEDALNKLSPSARTFVLALIALQDQWAAMRLGLQERFFSEFVDQIGTLPQIIRNIESFLGPAASSMGRFVDAFLRLLSSPEWSSDMTLIGESNGRIIDSMGRGVISLMNAIKDLIVAAAPFTEWLVSSLAIGAENFADLVKTGRESGDLARWLDKVAGRLERWWNIIKNIGATLFNYGAAASEFGDWMSEGFLETTENWRKASETARQEGSKFRDFLDELSKPGGLLENVNGLLGDFFGWLSKEIMNPDNIEDANDLVKLLRDDLGPAIGGLLDALAKTDIDEAFVQALASIIDSLTSIIDVGGGAGFEAFFDTIVAFFDALASLLGGLAPGTADILLAVLGGLAGLSFIGKFTGLTSAVGWLLKLDKAKFASLLGKGGLFAGLGLLLGGTLGGLDGDGAQGADALSSGLGGLAAGGAVGGVPGAALGFVGGLGISATTDVFDDKDGAWNKGWDQMFKPGDYSGAGIGQVKKWITDINAEMDGFREQWAGFWETDMPREVNNFFTDSDTNFRNWWSGIATGWSDFWGGVLEGWNKFWGTDVPNSWNTFVISFQEGWDGFWNPLRENWDLFWAGVGENWSIFWGETIPNAWTNFTLWLGQSWNGFWNGLGMGLQSMVDWFGQIWSGIQNRFKDPINWVINSVFNNGILAFWNGIAKTFGWSQLSPIGLIGGAPSSGGGGGGGRGALKYARGGVLPGDNQGVDNHHFVDQNGARLDLAGGEGILVPQAARALGGEKGIAQINHDAKRQKLAQGGVFGGNATTRGRPGTGAGWEVAGDVWDKMISFFRNPVSYVAGGMSKAVGAALSGFKTTDYNRLIASIPEKAIANFGSWSANQAKAAKRKEDLGMMGTEGMGWKAQWAAVKAAFPNANLNDSVRPAGTRTAGGSLSYHSLGRAIDVTASSSIFNWIKENYGAKSKELIYSPMGGSQISNGRPYNWGEPVRSMHWDHIHWAMNQGGQLPTKLYDSGGWLPNNGAAINRSGAPEAVLTAAESQALKGMLSGAGLAGSNQLGFPGANVGSLRGAAQQVNDYSVNVGTVEIHNPIPEKPSVSLPKAIRQIGYMQNARATG